MQPNIKNVLFFNSNGALVNVTGDWKLFNCQTGMETNSSNYSVNCQFDSTNYSPSATLSICRNAIKSIDYTFTHSQSTTSYIQQIDVVLTVQDIFFDTTLSQTPSITQSYSISWTDEPPTSSISNSSGNVVKRFLFLSKTCSLSYRSRSGNPGYLLGRPVLYGTLSGNMINMNEDGLEILKPPLQTLAKCPTLSSLDDFQAESIKFGYDLLTSCVISLNRSELKKFCCEGAASCGPANSDYSQSTGVPVFLTQVAG